MAVFAHASVKAVSCNCSNSVMRVSGNGQPTISGDLRAPMVVVGRTGWVEAFVMLGELVASFIVLVSTSWGVEFVGRLLVTLGEMTGSAANGAPMSVNTPCKPVLVVVLKTCGFAALLNPVGGWVVNERLASVVPGKLKFDVAESNASFLEFRFADRLLERLTSSSGWVTLSS